LRTAGAVLFFACAKKSTQKKAHPEPPKAPPLLAPAGRSPNSPSANNALRARHRLATPPAVAAMLGGGYGIERQHRIT
jgi:hypothetical protein